MKQIIVVMVNGSTITFPEGISQEKVFDKYGGREIILTSEEENIEVFCPNVIMNELDMDDETTLPLNSIRTKMTRFNLDHVSIQLVKEL